MANKSPKSSKATDASPVEVIKRPVQQVSASIKKSAWSAIAESIVILLFGILLVVWPEITIVVVANILGAIFIINGIYQIINYFVVKGQRDFLNNGLLFGVISLLVGIAVLIAGENIANVFRIIIGIWIIYEALVRVNTSIKLHAAGVKIWSYILIIALVMLALGIFVALNSGAVVQLIGWMMIATGVIGILSDTMFIQHVGSITESITDTIDELGDNVK